MVEIVTKVQAAISYKGGPEVWIPPALLHTTDAGVQFLKVAGSHWSICRIICGKDMERWKTWKNPSMSGSRRLHSLAGQLYEAAANVLRAQDEVFGGAVGPCAGPGAGAGAGEAGRQRDLDLRNLPETLRLSVNCQDVTVLAPKSWRKGDIWVQMDKDMLEAVFDWVAHDCNACYHQSKRGYKRKAAGEESGGGEGAGEETAEPGL